MKAKKTAKQIEKDSKLIGQFGVGFYSAFMVADSITIVTKSLNSDEAFIWESTGADGYTMEPTEKDEVGTETNLISLRATEPDKLASNQNER